MNPAPTIKAVPSSDMRTMRVTLTNMPPTLTYRGTFVPRLLSISSEHVTTELPPEVTIRLLEANYSNRRMAATGGAVVTYSNAAGFDEPEHIRNLPETVRGIVLGLRPDLTEQVRP